MDQKAKEFIPLRVLHLEDSPQDAELIQEMLTDAGLDLRIDHVATENKFVELLRSRTYDIILADFKLPGFDAFGALQWTTKICPETPFICVSGAIGEEAAVELIRLGADDYVLKDRLKRLPSTIIRALDETKEKEARKRVEEELHEKETDLKEAMKIAKLGTWKYDVQRDLFAFNDQFYNLFQTTAELEGGYIMSSSQYAQKFLHPDDMTLVGIETRKALETTDPDYTAQVDHRIICANGEIRHITVRIKIKKDDQGRTMMTYGVNQDITDRKQAEEKIRNNLKEKEILLKELYHRTKNNMQVISSMLRLRARSEKEQKLSDAFKDIENKILSMALVHQKLYESKDLSHLDLKDYLKSLISLITQSYLELSSQITIRTKMKSIHVLIDTAVPIGLIVNELLTNAIAHGFPNDRRGEIHVNLHVTPKKTFVLEISDTGIGLPKNFDFKNDIRLGLQTVIDLVEYQLDGKITFTSRNGLSCRLTFGEELYQPRI